MEPKAKHLKDDYDANVDAVIGWAVGLLETRSRWRFTITHELLCKKLRARGDEEKSLVEVAMKKAHRDGQITINPDGEKGVKYQLQSER